MARKTNRAAELAAILAKVSPLPAYRVADIVTTIQSIERRLHAIAERQCNGYSTWDHKWDQAAADRDEKREQRLEARLSLLVDELGGGVTATTQGDPRGCQVRLHVPGYSSDGWGDGLAVYS